jgi:hypothetical protein
MYLPPSLGSVRYAHEKGQRHAPVRYAECANVVWTDLGPVVSRPKIIPLSEVPGVKRDRAALGQGGH